MTIFRYKKNGKLYKLEQVKRRMYTEAPWIYPTPYKHSDSILNFDRRGNPKKIFKLEDFEEVAII